MDYKEKIRGLPGAPGVYIMKGEKGEALYVGKALNLKKRVSSYFQPRRNLPDRLETLVQNVRDIAYIPTRTEAEALIYENGLIKQLSPKYNVALRDDKSYPMLKLTLGEKFPRLFITRQKKADGSIYYGPYTNAKLLRRALVILRQVFPLRSCGKMKKSVCLNYHIKQCLGPCAGLVDETKYGEIVFELKMFLEGKRSELLKRLSERMAASSKEQKFEEAALYKIRLEGLSSVKEAVTYTPAGELEELGAILGIKRRPDMIEAFDVSNIMGKSAVGSMICFYKGRPRKSEYRKFKIKTVSGMDDYAMMREIVQRRYLRLVAEKRVLPDLILIDGGKGHLAAAADELEKLGLAKIPVIGIAKEFERIYLKGRPEPILLPRESKTLHLLERIRDEAHRFAISYHRKLMSKRIWER
ncbi:MAG: excinuclease ABC subunit UvrC [Candidatus Omnitrophica bacterium]|nr:excinuclease ABC subunit UvrC [Candidatus Omnitrophota bacterium]